MTLHYRPTTLDVVVDDDGKGSTGVDGGHGLFGIRERVALYGGSVTAGQRPDGGFRLAAFLKVRE